MLLIIHNLPINSKYADIKALIQSKCDVTEVILDNLVNEGQTKKVTVGLADDGDAAILARKINGIFVGGQQLYVEDVRQKKQSEQPYRSSKSLLAEPDSYTNSNYNAFSQSGYPRDSAPHSQNLLQPDNNVVYQNPDPMMMMNMAALGSMYYMPNMTQPQNSYMGYGSQMQMAPLMPQAPGVHAPIDRPFGFGADRAEENTHRDRQRLSHGDRRAPSPARGGRDMDRQPSRWDEGQSEARNNVRRRSPSPRRTQWDSRDRSNNQDRFEQRNYQDDLMTRNLSTLQNYSQPRQEMFSDNYNSNYGGSNALLEETPNVFGNHARQSLDSRWQQPVFEQNQLNQPDSNMDSNMGGRNDYQNPREGRNPSPRGSRPFEPRSSRGGPGPSRQSDNWRDESRPPPKRGNKMWDDDGPQAKRFAQSKDMQRGPPNAPRRPAPSNSGSRGLSNAPNRPEHPNFGPREPSKAANRSAHSNIGPGGPSNAPNRPAHPNFGPRGPSNAANRSAHSNTGPRGPSNAPNRSAHPNFGPRGPSNAPNNVNSGKTGPSSAPKRPAQAYPGPKSAAPNLKDKLVQGFSQTKNDPEPLEKLLNRDETWRGQSASTIAKELLKNLKVRLQVGDKIMTHLRKSVRARINVMLGDQISNRPEAIIEMYRQKFPSSGNHEFFSTVVNDLKEKEAEAAKQSNVEGSGPVKPKPAVPGPAGGSKPAIASAAKKPADKPAPKPTPPIKGEKLPKFPAGDKQANKRVKAEEKKAWRENNFELPEDLHKALDEEMDVLSDIFMSECMSPESEAEKPVCEQIADIVSDEFRKVIRIHVTKRLSPEPQNLIVRVFSAIRLVKRKPLETFLTKRGCVGLHKSDRFGKMYMAHFDSYDNYDKIVALGATEIDGLPISFKPFQLCGPPPSAAVIRQQHFERKKKFIESQIDKSKVNILQPGYVYDPRAENKTENNLQNTDNSRTAESEGAIDEEEYYEDDDVQEIDDAEIINLDEDEDEENEEGVINLDKVEDIPDDNVDEDDLEDW